MHIDLIKLSEIFKEGFTVTIKNGKIEPYNNIKKPYIVSYKTLMSISEGRTVFKNFNIPKNCIIGGWLDKSTNIYYIELNQAFASKPIAISYAKLSKQKAIYNYLTGKVIYVKK